MVSRSALDFVFRYVTRAHGARYLVQVDTGKANAMLDWTPPVSLEEGIRRMVEWYRDQR